ncbi:MAG: RNA polymerase sigma factor [Algoriphagus aquaeductus]|jgi:RNA polymerase sigma factor (sigma-70 family)|uniref:RNA polymerase sigma factor (Sigma-70 family) n=2 Tax=Algoriphagus TaxID=246875 RepID=A0A326RSK1_9BACT|nr:sigma-70 family RNA polymerase sigma factor [Algoriphagus aquaeductus]PZV83955.1 RNA polymerase sigma factor (sigma-70 family) [Algoriphagus aquaeductus]
MDVKEKQLELLKAGDRETLKQIYLSHKKGFRLFAKRYTSDDDLIDNAYQDAIIVLAENAQKGKIQTLNSSIGTYLYSVGKFILFKSLKKNHLTSELTEEVKEELISESFEEETKDEMILRLRQKLENLGPKCREILRLFYYQAKSLDEICQIMGYDSKEVLKSTKSRCLKSLKDTLNQT